MEFSYRISEEEYLSAARLKLKRASRLGRVRKTVMIWVFILAGLMFAVSAIQNYRQQPDNSDEIAVQTATTAQPMNAMSITIVLFVVFISILLYVIFRGVPMQLRRQYRKDPAMQGQISMSITPESISVENTAGASSKTGWNVYDYWCEGKGIIILAFHSGAYFLISLASLPETQQDELRGILTVALPKK
jgi:hypothetical protein